MTAEPQVPLLAATDPAVAAVHIDITSLRMEIAADDGHYGVISHAHPVVLAWVDVGGARLGLRLDCSGYPGQAPAGRPWNLGAGTPLPVRWWPQRGRAAQVFRPDWSPANGNAPYLACDRVGLATHPDWARQHPSRAWNSSRTLSDYLEAVQDALRGATLPDHGREA